MINRFILYPIIILFTLTIILLPSFLLSPQRNIRSVSKQVNPNQAQTLRSFSSFAKTFPNGKGFTLAFHTNNQPEYEGAEFVIITCLKDKLTVELIIGPGEDGIISYENNEARQFLVEHNIDISKFESTNEKDTK
tara:strand:- start:106 stop:510 length:405 start_codon:yes stop_codon:yes gene_type:complete